ncbi:myoD family inhibitor domain-containing protein [Terrapene carolina triunguis]|uniref:myoD family inhibitor domain-containing protein n=1 Tax=Terrapene triunguis TaxID=2587831 RepID=UPI000E77C5F5|nr:myoD family inhibitor domain-containing protein [Terrapene carolina triunguis]
MSQAREPLPPGPEGPAPAAPTERSLLVSLPREKCDKVNTAVGERDITPPSSNQSIQPEIQDQSVWGNRTDGDLIRNCCVHCILACLFCEFLTLCNIVLGQASCGICTSEACCCCCGDEMGDDCNCPCDMDCGIMDTCCESSDCLEICMECCGICFPT